MEFESADLPIVRGVVKAVKSLSKKLVQNCEDLEQAIETISTVRNRQLAEEMKYHAIREVLKDFEQAKKDVEEERLILEKLLPEEEKAIHSRVRSKEIEISSLSEEEEPGSIDEMLLDSDSDSVSSVSEKEEKKQIFGANEVYKSDDGFIASDSIDPEVFDDPKYDKNFGVAKLNTPKKKKKSKKALRRSKRKNKGKIELYSDVPENEQYGDELVEDLMQEEEDPEERAFRFSRADRGDCRQLLGMLRDGKPLKEVIRASPFFKKRYGHILDMIRDNLGLQGNNKEALLIWDHIAEDAFRGERVPEITKGAIYGIDDCDNTCGFCNNKRRCTWKLELRGMFHPIGTKCGELVKAVIYFFFLLHELVADANVSATDAITQLEKAICDVQEAHAGKALR